MFTHCSIVRPITILLTLLLASCGGAPADNPNISGGGNGGVATERDITVSVTGTSGTVVLSIGELNLTFSGDGSQTVSGVSSAEEVIARIVSVPEGESCFFTPSAQTEITVNRTADLECGGPSLSGYIKDFVSDSAIPAATIRVTHAAGELANITSGSDGSYSLENVTIGDRMVLSVRADGYAPYSAIVTITAQRPIFEQSIFLSRIDRAKTASPSDVMDFVLNGVTVLSVPANGLVTASGAAPTGDVTAEITLLDGSSEPRSLPGHYELSAGGHFETHGAISFVLKDSADNALSLAPSVNAVVSVPVAQRAKESIINGETQLIINTLYAFDETTGTWGDSQISRLVFEGVTYLYRSTVSSLSNVYSVGQPYPSGATVSGCLIDLQGNFVAGAQIITQGQDYIGLTYGTSDANGNFLIPAKPESDILVYGLMNTRSQTAEATTTEGVLVLNECILLDISTTVITLTWGINPVDLDSQLFGPESEGAARFHVFFNNKIVTVNGITMFLDVDDVTSFGPEVTTLQAFPLPGTYEFFVKLYAGTGTIANSPARVEVNAQGNSFVFSPRGGTVSECWHVFDIVVDNDLQGVVIPKNNWVSDSGCDNGLR